jgi:hypothetical protein
MGANQARELNRTLKQIDRADEVGLVTVNLPGKGIDDSIAARIATALG